MAIAGLAKRQRSTAELHCATAWGNQSCDGFGERRFARPAFANEPHCRARFDSQSNIIQRDIGRWFAKERRALASKLYGQILQ